MSRFEQLQHDLAGHFESYTGLAHVSVFAQRPRSAEELAVFQDAINRALAGHALKDGKAGLAVIVMLPEARVNAPHIPGPQVDLVFKVHVLEDVLVNEGDDGTGITAEEMALTLLGLGHLWKGGDNQIFFADTNQLSPLALDPQNTTASVGYEIVFRAPCAVTPLARVATPEATPSPVMGGHSVTLACATEDAQMFYTTDGTMPTPTNGYVFSTAFTVANGLLLRAAAYKDALCGSDVRETQL